MHSDEQILVYSAEWILVMSDGLGIGVWGMTEGKVRKYALADFWGGHCANAEAEFEARYDSKSE